MNEVAQWLHRPQVQTTMARIAEIGLISALFLAVLIFGSTEPLYFCVVQILVLGLCILLLVAYGTPRVDKPRLPVAIPLVLVALVLLQIVQLFRGTPDLPNESSYAGLSNASYQILSQLLLLLILGLSYASTQTDVDCLESKNPVGWCRACSRGVMSKKLVDLRQNARYPRWASYLGSDKF